MTKDPGTRLAVRPRTIVVAMAVIVIAAAAAVAASTLLEPEPPGRVRLAQFSEDSTSTVGFAGLFPADGDSALVNPLGIVSDGERLFVAESDAGVVRVFDAEGGQLGTISVTPAPDRPSVYPSMLALDGERLAIVDNAADRVVVVDDAPADPAEVLFSLGQSGGAPGQPTSVAWGGREWYVADAADGLIKVYDSEGALVRELGGDLEPALGFVGGLAYSDGALYVPDSNAGRVLVLDPYNGEQRAIFDDQYALPRAIVAMGPGDLAIVDTFDRAVYLVDEDGVRRGVIDAEAVPERMLASPRSVAWVAEDARLYVTDAAAGAVVVFNVSPEMQ